MVCFHWSTKTSLAGKVGRGKAENEDGGHIEKGLDRQPKEPGGPCRSPRAEQGTDVM